MYQFSSKCAFVFMIALLCAIADIAVACPTCKDGLHDDGTAAAFAISIIFMMSVPFFIFGGWTIAVYRMRRTNPALALTHLPNSLQDPS